MKNKNILIIVTGSIAAYKACEVVRLLRREGAEVQVMMTKSAQKFVGKTTFTALSNYAAVAIERARLSARVEEERRRRERLARYHSPPVVERILQTGSDGDDGMVAQERDISVLFADLVGFTTLSEGLPPSRLAELLNRCLTAMSDAVFEEEGTLDKFMGDATLSKSGIAYLMANARPMRYREMSVLEPQKRLRRPTSVIMDGQGRMFITDQWDADYAVI